MGLAVILVGTLALGSGAAVAADKSERTTSVSAAVGADAKININTASVKELMMLKGVGHKVAERIVEYREAHGPFKKSEDLRKVEGVGQGLLDRNRERIVTK
jgi:competence protein ComEA